VLTPPLHASVSRYTTAALAQAKHHEELLPAPNLQAAMRYTYMPRHAAPT